MNLSNTHTYIQKNTHAHTYIQCGRNEQRIPTLAELWQQRLQNEEERRKKLHHQQLVQNAEDARNGKFVSKLRIFKAGAKLKQGVSVLFI
jgi:hypothetical protein